jgi:hypothetical protein
MNQEVTRQILWNIPAGFVVFLYGMLIPLSAGFIYTGTRWYRIVRLGVATADSRCDQPGRRLFLALREGAGNGFVGRETWRWMHCTFIVAFIGLFIGTTIVLINDDLRELFALFGVPLYFYYGDFYLFFKAAMDNCFVMIVVGVVAASARRAVAKPTLLHHPPAPKLKDNWENRLIYGAAPSQVGQRARARRAARLDEQQPSGRPDGVAGQSLPPLKVHTKAIQALSRADGRWFCLWSNCQSF